MKEIKKQVTKNPIKAKVVSISKDLSTVKVSIPRVVPHKIYGKIMHLNTYIFADAKGLDNIYVNQIVSIIPCKKISKTKSWK